MSYTPTAQRIRDVWVLAGAPFTSPSKRTAEFDRAISKIKADALREAADGFRNCADYGYRATRPMATEDYLRARADRLDPS